MALIDGVILVAGFIIAYYILIQVYSVIFRITGLTKEKAKYQIISLLTGCGYTTGESELVVSDKTRRKIASSAMLLGSMFNIVIVALAVSTLSRYDKGAIKDNYKLLLIVLAIFVGIFIFFSLPFVKKASNRIIESIAYRFMRRHKSENIITVLDSYGKNAVVEVLINHVPTILIDKTLIQSNIKKQYNINVMAINRRGHVLEVDKDSMVQAGDIMVIYGDRQGIKDVFLSYDKSIAEYNISVDNTIDLIDNYGNDAMAEVMVNNVPQFMADKTVFESGIKEQYGITILMVTSSGKTMGVNKDTTIQSGDKVIVFGPYSNIKDIFLSANNEKTID